MSQSMTECLFCDGQGQVEEYQYNEVEVHPCSECNGSGQMSTVAYNTMYHAREALNRAILDADIHW